MRNLLRLRQRPIAASLVGKLRALLRVLQITSQLKHPNVLEASRLLRERLTTIRRRFAAFVYVVVVVDVGAEEERPGRRTVMMAAAPRISPDAKGTQLRREPAILSWVGRTAVSTGG